MLKANTKKNVYEIGSDKQDVTAQLITACKRDVLFWADRRFIKFEARLKFLQEKYCNMIFGK